MTVSQILKLWKLTSSIPRMMKFRMGMSLLVTKKKYKLMSMLSLLLITTLSMKKKISSAARHLEKVLRNAFSILDRKIDKCQVLKARFPQPRYRLSSTPHKMIQLSQCAQVYPHSCTCEPCQNKNSSNHLTWDRRQQSWGNWGSLAQRVT